MRRKTKTWIDNFVYAKIDRNASWLTWCSSFFFTFVGLSSSSSRLMLDATLLSALIIVLPLIWLLPLLLLLEIGVSSDEFGVTATKKNNKYQLIGCSKTEKWKFFGIFAVPLPKFLLLLLFVALGVLLLWPLEFDVESGISCDGNSHPWHDFFELESGVRASSE